MKTTSYFAARLLTASCLWVTLTSLQARPLKVDITAEDRTDMRTHGWENWLPIQGNEKRTFDGVTVSLGNRGPAPLRLMSDKALLVHGLTLGADGVVLAHEDQEGALLITLEGLTPGRHTFVGYHHPLKEHKGSYMIASGEASASGFRPSSEASHNDDIATSFLEFTADAGVPSVIHITAEEKGSIWLSGFALDLPDPRRQARKPLPADGDHHVPADEGTVTLQWAPATAAVHHEIYLATHRDPLRAYQEAHSASKASAAFLGESPGRTHTASVTPNNSLLHYAWRVDSVDHAGQVTRGEVWQFRIRHRAFPEAEGYGRFALGGRGGRVLHVTNLNDSGPGSLREAVEATGPRTVVFDVSGLITLKSKLIFRQENAYLTVAGQTAPGKGICLRNYTFGGLGSHDVILRHLRLRLGDLSGETMDGMGFASCDHCIIDHCSISWTIDEAFSSRGAKNITFQRNLISEALNIAGHQKYGQGSAHGFAGSIGGDIGSFHHSLLAHNAGRNWSLAGSIDQANRHAGRLDIRNMLVYNWATRTTDGGAREVQFVNNYYKPGPASKISTYLNPQFENPSFGPQQYYVNGNIMEGVCGPEGPRGPFLGMKVDGHQDAPVTLPSPFFEPHVITHTAEETLTNVLADVGCNVPCLDDHDKRVIDETRRGTATYRGSKSGLPGLPDSQEDVGGWEVYPEIRRPTGWDTDRDGMPNHWEKERGLDPDDPSDHLLDRDGDGFTALEDYLNQLAVGSSREP